MRKTLAVVVTTLALTAFAGPALAGGGCGGYTADKGAAGDDSVASSTHTSTPTSQTLVASDQTK